MSYYYYVDGLVCIDCGTCESLCSQNAVVDMGDFVVIDPAECNACGECEGSCPVEAIIKDWDPTPSPLPSLFDSGVKWENTINKWDGTPYSEMVCSQFVYCAYQENGLDYPIGYYTSNWETNPNFYPVTNPVTGDVVLFPAHMGIYVENPPISGYNIYGATSTGGVRYGEFSWFTGTPKYFRYKK